MRHVGQVDGVSSLMADNSVVHLWKMQVVKHLLFEALLPHSVLIMARMALPSQIVKVSRFSIQLISVLAFYFPYCLRYAFPRQL